MAPQTTDLDEAREFWDGQAADFDSDPDHGLLEEPVRQAWRELLLPLVRAKSRPSSAGTAGGCDVVDLGCGTGSLSVLLAQHGHRVLGVDLSDAMISVATEKARAANVSVKFSRGDANNPPLPKASADVVMTRHVLWGMPDPGAALARWVKLLRPGGRLLLIEGRWASGGIAAAEAEELVRDLGLAPGVQHLPDPALWGGPIHDERYYVIADVPIASSS